MCGRPNIRIAEFGQRPGLGPEPRLGTQSARAVASSGPGAVEGARGSRPLAAVRKYIKMNPARKMWKALNPDRFVRRSGLKHAVLDPTVEDSRFLADGRQLILSSFPSDVPVFPVNNDNCHLMNVRNEALCRRAMGEEEG